MGEARPTVSGAGEVQSELDAAFDGAGVAAGAVLDLAESPLVDAVDDFDSDDFVSVDGSVDEVLDDEDLALPPRLSVL